jgi:glycosyltransferase 2 family protein
VRLAPVIAAIVGTVLIGGLVAHFGAAGVLRTLLAVGAAGFAAICLVHLVLIAAMGAAWWVLLPGTRLWTAIWGRLVRDSGSEVLPLSQVGGYALGARAITVAGVSGTSATASTIVDVSLECVAQLAYTAFALGWLLRLKPGSELAAPAASGLAVAALLVAGFVAAQRCGFDLIGRFARATGRGWADRTAAGAAVLHAAIAAIYRRRVQLGIGFAIHLACWFAGTIEAWLALRFFRAPLGFGSVLVIESLLYAARSVAFAVPNAVGVQEGAYLLLGAGFGMTPDIALALSLLKRARDVAIGVPALGIWQLLESRRLWRRRLPVKRPACAKPT